MRKRHIAHAIILSALLTGPSAAAETQPQVEFLAKNAAATALVDDRAEPYFSRLQETEMAAKTGSQIGGATLEEMRTECRRRYAAAAEEFSAPEQEMLRWYAGRLHGLLAETYPLFAALPWSFLKVADNLEGGMPHTRGPHIVLSAAVVQELETCRQKYGETQAPLLAGLTLAHEQLHVFQRAHRDRFEKLYTEKWGMLKASQVETGAWLLKRQALNPDGTDCVWLLSAARDGKRRLLLPLIAFDGTSGVKQMPQDLRCYAVETAETETAGVYRVREDARGKPEKTNLLEEPAFRDRFPATTNLYHPNEIAAGMFAALLKYDAITDKGKLPEEFTTKMENALGGFRAWCEENLGDKAERGAEAPAAEKEKSDG